MLPALPAGSASLLRGVREKAWAEIPKRWGRKGDLVQIDGIRTLHGPNVYHHQPVLVLTLRLGDWTERSSAAIPGFAERLETLLPGIQEHTCSPGYVGGFSERLRRGTYLAHIVEHIALELSSLAGIGVSYGKTRYAGRAGLYEVVTRFKNENGMRACLTDAVAIARALVQDETFDISPAIEEIRELVSNSELGPSGRALYEEAKARGIPVRRIGEASLLELGHGRGIRRLQSAVSSSTSLIATDIAQDKHLTKELLQDAGIPVPRGVRIHSSAELEGALQKLDPPYAIKPLDGNQGKGVTLRIQTLAQARSAFEHAREYSSTVIVEEYCPGKDYRLLIVNGRLVAAAERTPPQVTGDGESTILELIEKLNTDPRRGDGHANIMSKVPLDAALTDTLAQQGFTLQSVVEAARIVTLRGNANLSTGGSAIDVTHRIHPAVRSVCERAARRIGLDICGIDAIHTDLSRPPSEGLKIIEVNACPGLRMHIAPSEGLARNVAASILDAIYPEPGAAQIPIYSVTGTNGKTTVARLISKITSQVEGSCVGLTTTGGVWIGDEKVLSGDTTGPASARVVLTDPRVTTAVLEVARGGILRGGLAYDWSDVSVITNIRPDHLGQNGLEDIEDLVWVKSLIAERVRAGGTLVLNADDPESLALKEHPRVARIPRNILLYTQNPQHPALHAHLMAGEMACWQEDGWITVTARTLEGTLRPQRLIHLRSVPLTFGGLAGFQVENALAATAACLGGGIPLPVIQQGLREFDPARDNDGRLSCFRIKKGHLILDYGHNADAITAVGKLLERLPGYRVTGILGLPGDRRTELLESAAAAASRCFDRVILREDKDLRGREPGEVARIMENAIRRHRPGIQCETILNSDEALHKALGRIQEGEIVVVFYDEWSPTYASIESFRPIPVSSIPPMADVVAINAPRVLAAKEPVYAQAH